MDGRAVGRTDGRAGGAFFHCTLFIGTDHALHLKQTHRCNNIKRLEMQNDYLRSRLNNHESVLIARVADACAQNRCAGDNP